jgi:hypothetical protein
MLDEPLLPSLLSLPMPLRDEPEAILSEFDLPIDEVDESIPLELDPVALELVEPLTPAVPDAAEPADPPAD